MASREKRQKNSIRYWKGHLYRGSAGKQWKTGHSWTPPLGPKGPCESQPEDPRDIKRLQNKWKTTRFFTSLWLWTTGRWPQVRWVRSHPVEAWPACGSEKLEEIPSGWWLGHPSEKYERQLGWWDSQYMGKYNWCSKPPTSHQFYPYFENLVWNFRGSWENWKLRWLALKRKFPRDMVLLWKVSFHPVSGQMFIGPQMTPWTRKASTIETKNICIEYRGVQSTSACGFKLWFESSTSSTVHTNL